MTSSQASCAENPIIDWDQCPVCLDTYETKTYSMPLGCKPVKVGSCKTCGEAAQAKIRERDERLRLEQRAADVRRLMNWSGIPKRYSESTLDTFTATTSAQTKVLNACRAYVENFQSASAKGPSMVMCGRPGTGKTHMACAIIAGVIEKHVQEGNFYTVLEAIRSIKDTYRKDSEQTETQVIDRLTGVPLLVLDEVGVQVGSEHEKMLVFEIINERYQQCRATILISNLPAPALSEYLGERIMDRFRECGGILAFDWQSHRGSQK